MAVQDFETYYFSDEIPHAVIPRPSNDRYANLWVPTRNILDTATIRAVIDADLPYKRTEVVEEGEFDGFDYVLQGKGCRAERPHPVVKSHTTVTLYPKAEELIDLDEMERVALKGFYNLYAALRKGRSLLTPEKGDEPDDPASSRIERLLIPDVYLDEPMAYSTDSNDQPRNPYLKFANVLEVRAYEWKQGPPHNPVWTIHAAHTIVANSCKVQMINPFANSA